VPEYDPAIAASSQRELETAEATVVFVATSAWSATGVIIAVVNK
jgi:hypothetical protein